MAKPRFATKPPATTAPAGARAPRFAVKTAGHAPPPKVHPVDEFLDGLRTWEAEITLREDPASLGDDELAALLYSHPYDSPHWIAVWFVSTVAKVEFLDAFARRFGKLRGDKYIRAAEVAERLLAFSEGQARPGAGAPRTFAVRTVAPVAEPKERPVDRTGFRARAQREKERMAISTDGEFWFCLVCDSAEHKDTFLAALAEWAGEQGTLPIAVWDEGAERITSHMLEGEHGDRLDGRLLAQTLGLELTTPTPAWPRQQPFNRRWLRMVET
jgi:hypothetical protein